MNRAGAFLLALGLVVAAAGETSEPLRFGAPWPLGSKAMADLQAAARRLARQTDGRLNLRFVEQMDLGAGDESLAGMLLAGESLFRRSPAARVLALPMLAGNASESAALLAGFADAMAADLDGDGWAVLATLDLGFAYLVSMRPIARPADLESLRFWVPAGDSDSLRVFESFGVRGVPLEARAVRDALRTGELDALAVPPLGAIVMQCHVEVRHVLDDPLVHLAGVAAMRRGVLERMDPTDRRLVQEELAAAFEAIAADLRRQESESLEVLILSGVARTPVEAEEGRRAEWDAWAREVADRLVAGGHVSADGVAQARRLRESSPGGP